MCESNSWEPGFLAPITREIIICALDTSVGVSGPHDFTSALSMLVVHRLRVHRIPASRVVTIARTPLCIEAGCAHHTSDLRKQQSEIFFSVGLDSISEKLPVGQITGIHASSFVDKDVDGRDISREVALRAFARP
ncbi:hypothetical protein [Bradyrhizobium sp.]|uniref:hypothetical protein n=1 Tax=Bradyrhizobium sp. TaxID=376 RepID=UPI001EB5FD37|nr:hypothetical protein [Bradyrhizobium sp.]MBV9984102.1 hypothetical protein [Bradyrhizobium sp.]